MTDTIIRIDAAEQAAEQAGLTCPQAVSCLLWALCDRGGKAREAYLDLHDAAARTGVFRFDIDDLAKAAGMTSDQMLALWPDAIETYGGAIKRGGKGH